MKTIMLLQIVVYFYCDEKQKLLTLKFLFKSGLWQQSSGKYFASLTTLVYTVHEITSYMKDVYIFEVNKINLHDICETWERIFEINHLK